MRAVRTLIVVTLLAATNVASQTRSDESFETFLDHFASDAAFRAGRTSDPLPVHIGNEAISDVVNGRWAAARISAETSPLLSAQGLAAQGLKQRITKLGARTVEVLQYRDEADSYLITYRFELRKGKWFLAAYVDESM